eukprot:190732-Chlamydomonas_euryale.AAC.4
MEKGIRPLRKGGVGRAGRGLEGYLIYLPRNVVPKMPTAPSAAHSPPSRFRDTAAHCTIARAYATTSAAAGGIGGCRRAHSVILRSHRPSVER